MTGETQWTRPTGDAFVIPLGLIQVSASHPGLPLPVLTFLSANSPASSIRLCPLSQPLTHSTTHQHSSAFVAQQARTARYPPLAHQRVSENVQQVWSAPAAFA